MAVGTPDDEKPIQTKADWPKVQKMLANYDVKEKGPV